MPSRKIATCLMAALFALFGVVGMAHAGDKKPLKIYILVGQSNMQGQASAATFPAMAEDSVSKALYAKFVDKSGKPRVYNDVRVTAISQQGAWGAPVVDKQKAGPLTVGFGSALTSEDRFGPELGFGVTMFEHQNEPILIIKTSWGGKSLHTDFRPPSGGPYYETTEGVKDRKTHKGELITAEKQIADKIAATGKYYRLMSGHVQQVLADPGKYHPAYDKDAGYEVAGFVWFQGFNDMVGPYPTTLTNDGKKGPKDYALYSKLLACFIRDVRKDFNAPKMPFVIGVIGVGGNPDKPDVFRDAMAAPAALLEFKGNVVAVHTAQYWDHELDERLNRFKKVTSSDDPGPENQYTEMRQELAPLLKEFSEAQKREKQIGRKVKASKSKESDLTAEEKKALTEQMRTARKTMKEIEANIKASIYTEEEVRAMTIGRGSQGYHYHGSAKILGRIGEAFANALVDLNGAPNPNHQ